MTAPRKLFSPRHASPPQLSLVIPLYNEREVLPLCLQRIDQVLSEMPLTTELVFVDDGIVHARPQFESEIINWFDAHAENLDLVTAPIAVPGAKPRWV